MTARDLSVIDALVRHAPQVLDRHYAIDRCVASTREGAEVLSYFGITAKPMKTQACVGNRAWHDWIEQSDDITPPPEEAYSVYVDVETHAEGRYAGHLVLLVEDVLVDLALGQFSRPDHNMPMPDARAFRLHEDAQTHGYWVGEAVVVYRFLPERDWTATKGWRRKPRAAGDIIRAIREEVSG